MFQEDRGGPSFDRVWRWRMALGRAVVGSLLALGMLGCGGNPSNPLAEGRIPGNDLPEGKSPAPEAERITSQQE